MSDISSSTSPEQSPRVRRCRKTRKGRGGGKQPQTKRFSSCGIVRMSPNAWPQQRVPKPSLSSPEDLEVDSILQSSSSGDDGNISSSISSDDEEENSSNNQPSKKSNSSKNMKHFHLTKPSKKYFSKLKENKSVHSDINPNGSEQSSKKLVANGMRSISEEPEISKGTHGSRSTLTEKTRNSNDVSSESSRGASSATKISHLERLIRTHPVWFQPDLRRDDTTELLQGKEDGVSINIRFK